MPGTAATSLSARDPRVRAAATAIALAYLRLLSEGDSVRASIVLASFQSFWNRHSSSIAVYMADPSRLPRALEVSGAFDFNTQYAVVVVFAQSELVDEQDRRTLAGGAGPMLALFNNRIRPRVADDSMLWLAYRRARGVAVQDAGTAVDAWAFEFVEAVGETGVGFDALLDTLADDQAAGGDEPGAGGAVSIPSRCAPPTVWDVAAGACMYPTALVIPGITSLRAKRTPWGWWLAGGVFTLAAFGLGWRIWKKRGRR